MSFSGTVAISCSMSVNPATRSFSLVSGSFAKRRSDPTISTPQWQLMALTLRRVSFGVTVGLEGGAESVGLAGDGPPRPATRTASQTSSQAAVRSTPCSTSSRLKASLSSPITTIGGSSPRDQITAADLALDGEAERFEIAFHRRMSQAFSVAAACDLRRMSVMSTSVAHDRLKCRPVGDERTTKF